MTAPGSTLRAPSAQTLQLLDQLLLEQQDLSAVERYSAWHEGSMQELSISPAENHVYSALMPASPPGPGEQLAFEVDLDACSGCKACVVACHKLNGLADDETWRRVGLLIGSSNELPIVQHVTAACHHCIEPGCLTGCPVLAYEKDPLTGIVKHLDDQCFGCKYCTMMCPYDVPQYSSTLGIVRKCDLCVQRISVNEAPACVQACPNQAIRVRTVRTDECRANGGDQSLVSTAPPNNLTSPTTRYLSSNPASGTAMPVDLSLDVAHDSHTPLACMLVLSQASAGLWCWLAWAVLTRTEATSTFVTGCLVATIVGMIGIHLAMLHLGRPWLAFRAVLGWRTSWLSREAIVFGLFIMSMGIATTGACLSAPPATPIPSQGFADSPFYASPARRILPWATLAAGCTGLAGVYCSVMIYVATRRMLWNAMRTGSQFFGTVIGAGMSLASATNSAMSQQSDSATWAWLACLGSAIAIAGSWPLAQCYCLGAKARFDWTDFKVRSGRVMRRDLLRESTACAVLHGIALCCAICCVAIASSWLLGVSAVALVAGQILARRLYFASVVTHRMPGASL